MNIKPTPNYILVRINTERETKTDGGIFLPETKTDVHQSGTVIEGGEYKSGSLIYFKRWAGEEIDYEGTTYHLVHVKDVIAYED